MNGGALLGISHAISENRGSADRPHAADSHALSGRAQPAIYAFALAVSISFWFSALRSPLWLDETSSYWQISHGFGQILSRRGEVSAAYPYILWLTSRITGTSEIALRVPSILAMLAAVFLLYRAARELFGRDVAFITVILFCSHPIVVFAAIDARPYAFGALAINATILALVRLRHRDSNWLAAAFGIGAAASTHFQVLFGAVLLVLAVCFLATKTGNTRSLLRQSAIALAAFVVGFAPLLPDLFHLFRNRQAYVFDRTPPRLLELASTLAPGWLAFILGGAVILGVATGTLALRTRVDRWPFLVSASLGLIPILILYGVSAGTSTNIFVARYRLVAIPGIALLWGWLISRINSESLRVAFCIAVVSAAAVRHFRSPNVNQHGYTWKYALAVAENNAAPDNATVLICSDFPSADYYPMPAPAAVKDSGFFTQLSYYELTAPVVGLPRRFNDQARRITSDFVQEAAQRRERFLALGFRASIETLHWLREITSDTYEVNMLGQPDGVLVLEFKPRAVPTESR